MSLFGFFKRRGTAPVARERLQLLLAHERTTAGKSDLIALLRADILKVIEKHISVEPEDVHVTMQSDKAISTLTVDIEIPESFEVLLAANG